MRSNDTTPEPFAEAAIPFDAPGDLTACHCGSSERYDHIHVTCCGKKAYTQDGGVQDGFLQCVSCKDYVCNERGHVFYIDAGKPLCAECEHEEAGKIFDDCLLENGLANASEDIRDSHKRMLSETDTARLRNLDVHISVLKTQILLFERALNQKLAAHNALPFVFGDVA